MPRVVKILIQETITGSAFGVVILVLWAVTDQTGMAQSLLKLPVPLLVPVVLGGLLPFAVSYAATSLELRARYDDEQNRMTDGDRSEKAARR
jgi:hypothetical protein